MSQPHQPAAQFGAVQLAGSHAEGIKVRLGGPVSVLSLRRRGPAVVGLRRDQQLPAHEQGVETHLDRQEIELGDGASPRAPGAFLRLLLRRPWPRLPPLLQQPQQLVSDRRIVASLRKFGNLALHARFEFARRLMIGPAREVTPERVAPILLVKRH
jgi:hypothetical protein